MCPVSNTLLYNVDYFMALCCFFFKYTCPYLTTVLSMMKYLCIRSADYAKKNLKKIRQKRRSVKGNFFFYEFVVGWKSFRHNSQKSCTENCFVLRRKKKKFVRVFFASQLLLRIFGIMIVKKTRNQGNVKNKKKSIVITTRDERGRDFFFVCFISLAGHYYKTTPNTDTYSMFEFYEKQKTSKGEAGRRLNNK